MQDISSFFVSKRETKWQIYKTSRLYPKLQFIRKRVLKRSAQCKALPHIELMRDFMALGRDAEEQFLLTGLGGGKKNCCFCKLWVIWWGNPSVCCANVQRVRYCDRPSWSEPMISSAHIELSSQHLSHTIAAVVNPAAMSHCHIQGSNSLLARGIGR